ncbi:HupE/UreJ family protein [Anianabacter salinae]|uniref:HupE/UreJ family protein n=1 Tax=Anianabacter salinae TaxID=2851023 RepID=UPI00225E2864|nr:HupE/UreJ family protein [Anianabacter salinae]MBV0912625.1 HupE/UreJ family protein [Anianabacter salinae]
MASIRSGSIMAKLVYRRVVSSILLALALTFAAPSGAHEVRPAIADLTLEGSTARIQVTLALEALVAGVDLQGLSDTDESPNAARYDRLRALPPADLRAALDEAWPDIRDGFVFEVDGARLVPQIVETDIPPVGNAELPRDSVLTIAADLPPGDAPLQVGWIAEYGPLVVRQQGAGDGEGYSGYLTGGQLSDPIPRDGVADVGLLAAFGSYVLIGYEHIVPKGLDHILFVLGLFFFSLQLRPLVLQITAFTAAHTVTLALATLGYVTISPAIVEPLIAASIVYVAVENVLVTRMHWWRTAIVFGFGLLHGLGFASVLGDIGLNPARFVTGLIGFNVGVELGQLSVILLAWITLAYWFGNKPWWRSRIAVPASLAIAAVAAYWFVERTFLA